jgi:hypothetical protein
LFYNYCFNIWVSRIILTVRKVKLLLLSFLIYEVCLEEHWSHLISAGGRWWWSHEKSWVIFVVVVFFHFREETLETNLPSLCRVSHFGKIILNNKYWKKSRKEEEEKIFKTECVCVFMLYFVFKEYVLAWKLVIKIKTSRWIQILMISFKARKKHCFTKKN